MALANTNQAIGAVTRLLADHLNRRTNYPVNLGTITNAINALNVGVAYRF